METRLDDGTLLRIVRTLHGKILVALLRPGTSPYGHGWQPQASCLLSDAETHELKVLVMAKQPETDWPRLG